MSADNELKVLVFTMKTGLKRQIKELLEGKTIRLTFSDTSEPSKVPRRVLKGHDSFCIASQMEDERVTLFVQTYPALNKPKKKTKKKVLTKRKRKR
ncbi:MAG: hypothetical protein KDD40_00905 [Bdellovibrionales bacterium]|nr:hypothetical protein [Bdellovibrionales bacterium]